MPQCIVLPVGQCGNQIASRFWDLSLQELAATPTATSLATSTFFDKPTPKSPLRARSVLTDMEPGVLTHLLSTPLSHLFTDAQIVSSASGSGNNWGMGYAHYGPQFGAEILDKIRIQAENCDSLQSFFLINSLGGGTGSGLGSWILEQLEDVYPHVFRFATVVCPSEDDDVVTSPYNTLLSVSKLVDHADCVVPVENGALMRICERIREGVGKEWRGVVKGVGGSGGKAFGGLLGKVKGSKKGEVPFEEMNNVVANLIVNMTRNGGRSMRFEGSMNVDINDIVTNLVPFPKRKFLVSSMTPLYTLSNVNVPSRRLDQMFSDAFSKDTQLISADPKSHVYLACALMIRGDVEVSDVRRNVDR
ncbi:Tubulin epsilon chain, partial [Podochytrium sp. JEL0797]